MSIKSNHSAPFVRKAMLVDQAPPASEKGVIKWVGDNLFSSWLNVILTIVSIWIVYSLVVDALPWFINAIWDASSLFECREILSTQGLGPSDGACFAVINDRWHQLVFGFYPPEFYWRPIAALLLFLLGLAPILFLLLPRALLVFTCLAPFICFWLLWGGSICFPVSIFFGFVLGYLTLKYLEPVVGTLLTSIAAILIPVLYWVFLCGPLSNAMHTTFPLGLVAVESRAFGGFMLSLVIGLSAIVLSLPLGVLLALSRQSNLPLIRWFSITFIEVVRGVPLIVWLFTAQLLLNYFLPPGTNFDLTLRVIIMVTLFSAADLAEVIRGGLAALPKGQLEGAESLGLNYWLSMRLIVLPQALKISIPNIVNSFIGLFKDTTLVVFIGLLDPLGIVSAIRASTDWNGIYWELFLAIGVLFFIACFSMARYSLYLERLLQREHK